MPGISIPLQVKLDDGTEYKVVVDQRDIAAFELQPFGCSYTQVAASRIMTFMRWTAWHALRRTGQIDRKTGWATFDEQCEYASDEEPAEEGSEDPTSRDQSAGN